MNQQITYRRGYPPALPLDYGEPHSLAFQEAVTATSQLLSSGLMPALNILHSHEELERARLWAQRLAPFHQIVVFGMGGSSLGGQAISALRAVPRVRYVDNVDDHTLSHLLSSLDFQDPHKTGFLIISKSGQTLETMAHAALLFSWITTQVPEQTQTIQERVLVLTESPHNPLAELATSYGCQLIPVDASIGGRYSVFSIIGLLPLLLEGLDAEAFLGGARSTLVEFLSPHVLEHSATLSAGLQAFLLSTGSLSQHVIMPYADRLFPFAQWCQQLIGESLGKNSKGITPLASRGSVDQHSQLQLYLEGPQDKLVTLIGFHSQGKGLRLSMPPDNAFSYLNHHTLGDVMWAEQEATFSALTHYLRPAQMLVCDTLTEATLGSLMIHMVLETLILAQVMGINPFDQPAVEYGKIVARKLLQSI